MKKDDKKLIFMRMFLALVVIFVVIYFVSVIAGFTPSSFLFLIVRLIVLLGHLFGF